MRTLLTVPEELIEYAEAAIRYYNGRGYRVILEPSELAFPFTPTMMCVRKPTMIICEVHEKVPMERMKSWVGYGKTMNRDTRIVLALTDTAKVKATEEKELRNLGVGVLVCTGGDAFERFSPRDQAVAVELPDLKTLPMKVRRLLAPAYEQFERGDWREGFREACQILETEARRNLKNGLERGRVRLLTPSGGVSKQTVAGVDRMTLGNLASAYGRMDSPNHADSLVEKILLHLNKDRVGVTHHKAKPATEARLRKNVGQHMFAIVNALKALADN
jgi:hypothetical protein